MSRAGTDPPRLPRPRRLHRPPPAAPGLVVSPDGTRLVTARRHARPDGTRYRTALWEIDPGRRAAGPPAHPRRPRRARRRVHPRRRPAVPLRPPRPRRRSADDDPPPALWRLPAGGGEAVAAGTPARWAGRAGRRPGRGHRRLPRRRPCPAPSPPRTTPPGARRARTPRSTAILHDGTPVRFWDHDLGPDRPRLLAASPIAAEPAAATADLDRPHPDAGGALDQADTTSPRTGRRSSPRGGSTEPHGASARTTLVALDVAGGRGRRTLLDDAGHTVDGPVAVTPDGRWVACLREPPDHRHRTPGPPLRRGAARRQRRPGRGPRRRPGLGPLDHRVRLDARLRGPRRDRRRRRAARRSSASTSPAAPPPG